MLQIPSPTEGTRPDRNPMQLHSMDHLVLRRISTSDLWTFTLTLDLIFDSRFLLPVPPTVTDTNI